MKKLIISAIFIIFISAETSDNKNTQEYCSHREQLYPRNVFRTLATHSCIKYLTSNEDISNSTCKTISADDGQLYNIPCIPKRELFNLLARGADEIKQPVQNVKKLVKCVRNVLACCRKNKELNKTCITPNIMYPGDLSKKCAFKSQSIVHIVMLGVSLLLTIPCVVIMFSYRSLIGNPWTLHRNLIGVLVFRSLLSLLIQTQIILPGIGKIICDINTGNQSSDKAIVSLEAIFLNFVSTFWLLESVYVRNRVADCFERKTRMAWYIAGAAGIALLPAVTWIIVLSVVNSPECYSWSRSDNGLHWINDAFRLTFIALQIIFLADAIRLLFTRVKGNTAPPEASVIRKLTITLIVLSPLFLLQTILIASKPNSNNCNDGYFFLTYVIDGLQGAIVAVTIGYMDKEVRKNLRGTFIKMMTSLGKTEEVLPTVTIERSDRDIATTEYLNLPSTDDVRYSSVVSDKGFKQVMNLQKTYNSGKNVVVYENETFHDCSSSSMSSSRSSQSTVRKKHESVELKLSTSSSSYHDISSTSNDRKISTTTEFYDPIEVEPNDNKKERLTESLKPPEPPLRKNVPSPFFRQKQEEEKARKTNKTSSSSDKKIEISPPNEQRSIDVNEWLVKSEMAKKEEEKQEEIENDSPEVKIKMDRIYDENNNQDLREAIESSSSSSSSEEEESEKKIEYLNPRKSLLSETTLQNDLYADLRVSREKKSNRDSVDIGQVYSTMWSKYKDKKLKNKTEHNTWPKIGTFETNNDRLVVKEAESMPVDNEQILKVQNSSSSDNDKKNFDLDRDQSEGNIAYKPTPSNVSSSSSDDEVSEQNSFSDDESSEQNSFSDDEVTKQASSSDHEGSEHKSSSDDEGSEHKSSSDDEVTKQASSSDHEVTKQKSSSDDEVTKQESSSDDEVTKQEISSADDGSEQKSSSNDEGSEQRCSSDEESSKQKSPLEVEVSKQKSFSEDEDSEQRRSSHDEASKQKSSSEDEDSKQKSFSEDEDSKQNSFLEDEDSKHKSSSDDEGSEHKSSSDDEGSEHKSSSDEEGSEQKSSSEDEGSKQRISSHDEDSNKRSSFDNENLWKNARQMTAGRLINDEIPRPVVDVQSRLSDNENPEQTIGVSKSSSNEKNLKPILDTQSGSSNSGSSSKHSCSAYDKDPNHEGDSQSSSSDNSDLVIELQRSSSDDENPERSIPNPSEIVDLSRSPDDSTEQKPSDDMKEGKRKSMGSSSLESEAGIVENISTRDNKPPTAEPYEENSIVNSRSTGKSSSSSSDESEVDSKAKVTVPKKFVDPLPQAGTSNHTFHHIQTPSIKLEKNGLAFNIDEILSDYILDHPETQRESSADIFVEDAELKSLLKNRDQIISSSSSCYSSSSESVQSKHEIIKQMTPVSTNNNIPRDEITDKKENKKVQSKPSWRSGQSSSSSSDKSKSSKERSSPRISLARREKNRMMNTKQYNSSSDEEVSVPVPRPAMRKTLSIEGIDRQPPVPMLRKTLSKEILKSSSSSSSSSEDDNSDNIDNNDVKKKSHGEGSDEDWSVDL